jgi:hypothetical protein
MAGSTIPEALGMMPNLQILYLSQEMVRKRTLPYFVTG